MLRCTLPYLKALIAVWLLVALVPSLSTTLLPVEDDWEVTVTVDDIQRPDTSLRSLRLLLILEEIARLGFPATPTEVNRAIGLPKQTLHRMFVSLERQGFLQREHDGRSYSPGPRMQSMVIGTLASSPSRAIRSAIMGRLSEDVGETCNLSIPDRHAMVYVDRVEADWPLRIQFPIGSKVPLNCTASGKLYLSTLSDLQLSRLFNNTKFKKHTRSSLTDPKALQQQVELIRAREFSEDNEEFVEGMIAVAVPINDEQGRFMSSLSFHAPTQRMSLSAAYKHIDRLRKAAAELAKMIVECA